MNKYFVLSASALVFSLIIGCQNCGYKTAHSSRYQSLVGTTRLASPQTNCRYNTCNACNVCNSCDTQMLANNEQLSQNYYAQDGYQNGWYQSYTGENASANNSLLDGTQQQTAQSETPLRWRRVTDEEQQYANSTVNPTSAGIASALNAPAFGSPAPAPAVVSQADFYDREAMEGVSSAVSRRPRPAPNAAPPYSGRYPGQRPDFSPRTTMEVASAIAPGRPSPGPAPQYSNQYPNYSPRVSSDVNSTLSVPGHPLPPQYSNPNYSPRASVGPNSAPGYPEYGSANSDSVHWRRVTEEEQRYSNPSHRSAPGAPSQLNSPGYGAPTYPNSQYPVSETQDQLTVPVYPDNSMDSAQMQGNQTTPEIDPNVLPMPSSQTGAF